MKIIFLDFDGVLNDSKWLQDAAKHHDQNREFFDKKGWNWLSMIDPSKVELLNQIVEKTGCKFVISSSWRIANPADELQDMLVHHGFKGEIIGSTPSLFRRPRGHEIQAWLDHEAHIQNVDVHEFVILDDESDMGRFMAKLVQTKFGHDDERGGLTQDHVDEIIRRLNS